MSASAFVDTNVLVYGHDLRAGAKHSRALELVTALRHQQRVVVSTQVLAEFASVTTGKLEVCLTRAAAADAVRDFMEAFEVVPVYSETVDEALRGWGSYGLSYWDAQIWAAAILGDVSLVLSEDFSDGMEIEGVRFADPFADGFDLEAAFADE